MIRYHEAHGHLPSRGRTAGRQRNFDEQDVHWLRNLQTQLAAGVPTPTAMRALRGELSGLEQEAIDRALAEWQRAYIPGHLQTTYRLDFLGQRAARVAIQRSRARV